MVCFDPVGVDHYLLERNIPSFSCTFLCVTFLRLYQVPSWGRLSVQYTFFSRGIKYLLGVVLPYSSTPFFQEVSSTFLGSFAHAPFFQKLSSSFLGPFVLTPFFSRGEKIRFISFLFIFIPYSPSLHWMIYFSFFLSYSLHFSRHLFCVGRWPQRLTSFPVIFVYLFYVFTPLSPRNSCMKMCRQFDAC